MSLSDRRTNMFLLTVQSIGVVFLTVFLAAYLGGLPTTNVLHSEPSFRWLLQVFGVLFLILILAVAVVSVLFKNENQV